MKYDVNSYSEVDVETTTIEKDLTLSADSASIIFQMFSKNIYSNPIGSIVREITSNCFDSHVEAGVNLPIVIRKSFDNETQTTYISFIDYGMGMSPERIDKIFSVYFSSTKRQDNSQIGGFGLGSKSPLAYKRSTGFGDGEYDNSYSIITNYNCTKYTYLIYEGKKCPKISLLYQEPTSDHNGTEVRIPVLQKDLSAFKKEMVRQLYYFENIIFECFDEETTTDDILNNEYQIVRGKSFLYRGKEYLNNVHVCLGRVAYPLDYAVLGLNASDYPYPLAIRLEVGDINVTVSRETIDYSESTIKMLKKKLIEVKAELTQMLTKQYDSIVSLEDYFRLKKKFGYIYFPNDTCFSVGETIKLKDVDLSAFKYNFMKMPVDKVLFEFFFKCKLHGKPEKKRRSYYNDKKEFDGSYEDISTNQALYRFEDQFDRKTIKQAYLKSIHERYYMISKKDILKDDLECRVEIANVFNVHDKIFDVDNEGNKQVTPYIQTILDLQQEFFDIISKYSTDYNVLEVPLSFIEERKREKISKEMLNTSIPVKFFNSGYRYRVKLQTIFSANFKIYYGVKGDENKLTDASNIYNLLFNADDIIKKYDENTNRFKYNAGKRGIIFILIAQNNLPYMKFCKNAFPIADFQKQMIPRKTDAVMKYFQVERFVNKYNSLNEIFKCTAVTNLSPTWANKIEKVTKYINSVKTNENSDWSYYISHIKKYYDLTNINPTKEQLKYDAILDEAIIMQELNADALRYINIPYNLNNAPQSFWNILRKILIF